MKKLIILTLALFTHSIAIARTYTITSPDLDYEYRRKDIRHGGFFEDPTFTPFFMELQIKLARLGVEVSSSKDTYYTDATLEYNAVMDQDDFYHLFPDAKINASLTFTKDRIPYKTVKFTVDCGYLVQDGGNRTLKMSCVRKLSKAISKTLKENVQ